MTTKAAVTIILTLALSFGASALTPNEQLYDSMLDELFSDSRVVTTAGNNMWVPWYKSSSSCQLSDLHSGNACNAFIDGTHNCMVSDEFSQVGMLVAMGTNEERFAQFFNTVKATKSNKGIIPAWRVYRNGNTIEPCKDGINGNCDTASDATARILIALFTAANNPAFERQAEYSAYAEQLAADMLKYEVVNECKPTLFGESCYWLAAGAGARSGGVSSNNFAYTGYFGDAIIAMLFACQNTGDARYCQAADDFGKNYLQAAQWQGTSFRVPPGKAFRWGSSNGLPVAECTDTCSPAQWDNADAPRAFSVCQANYYADHMNMTLTGLPQYCEQWAAKYLRMPDKAPLQYFPNGDISASYQSGYFAQGLQAIFYTGDEFFWDVLGSALSHYNPSTGSWDYEACFGVYTHAFAVRALGNGLGRDLHGFDVPVSLEETVPEPVTTPEEPIVLPEDPVPEEPVVTEPEPTVEEPKPVPGGIYLGISVKPPYPKGSDYVFVCAAEGFTPDSYDWYFDDGDKQVYTNNRDVYHSYKQAGQYFVRCIARDDGRTFQAGMTISV